MKILCFFLCSVWGSHLKILPVFELRDHFWQELEAIYDARNQTGTLHFWPHSCHFLIIQFMFLICNSTAHAFHLTSYSWVCMTFLKNYSNMCKMLCHLSLLGIKSDPLDFGRLGEWRIQRCSMFSPNSAQGSILAGPRELYEVLTIKMASATSKAESFNPILSPYPFFFWSCSPAHAVRQLSQLKLYCCIIVSLSIKNFLFICSCTVLK